MCGAAAGGDAQRAFWNVTEVPMNSPFPEKTTVHYKGRQRSILGKVSLGVGLSALFFLVFLILYGRAHELPLS